MSQGSDPPAIVEPPKTAQWLVPMLIAAVIGFTVSSGLGWLWGRHGWPGKTFVFWTGYFLVMSLEQAFVDPVSRSRPMAIRLRMFSIGCLVGLVFAAVTQWWRPEP